MAAAFVLDAVVVGAPMGDALFDLVFGETFRGCALGKGCDFCVGGEAQCDELPKGQGIDQA